MCCSSHFCQVYANKTNLQNKEIHLRNVNGQARIHSETCCSWADKKGNCAMPAPRTGICNTLACPVAANRTSARMRSKQNRSRAAILHCPVSKNPSFCPVAAFVASFWHLAPLCRHAANQCSRRITLIIMPVLK